MLQRIFTSSILLLAAIWESHKLSAEALNQDSPANNDRLAVWVLDQLSLLQFCRSRLNVYSDLLAEVYTVAARSREVGSQLADACRFPVEILGYPEYIEPWKWKDNIS